MGFFFKGLRYEKGSADRTTVIAVRKLVTMETILMKITGQRQLFLLCINYLHGFAVCAEIWIF
jgi:hypothetical protein